MAASNTMSQTAKILNMADEWALTTRIAAQAPAHDIMLMRDADARQTPEARLQAQVADLDRLFIGLAQRAAQTNDAHATDLLLRLALRCQQQTTRAVATLAEMKSRQRAVVEEVVNIN